MAEKCDNDGDKKAFRIPEGMKLLLPVLLFSSNNNSNNLLQVWALWWVSASQWASE